MLFFGPVAEQALVVNIRGFGLVLITGCGHTRIEQILRFTEHVLDAPIRAVIGGPLATATRPCASAANYG